MEADEEGYYIRGDYVGKLGVERSYEKYLRGEKGVEILLRANIDERGFYTEGENVRKHKITGTYYDPSGYDIDNHDIEGYNPEGYDYDGYTREDYKKILNNKKK